ncbi:MAG: thioredoxin family protein [Anaerolineales bacterium]|nr:thioredoxin family protein [Anaerolineales bacterium]
MGTFINYYSFLLVSVGVVGLAALILLTHKPKNKDYLSFGLIAFGVLLAWVILHPRQTPLMDDSKTVLNMIGSGTPVLLEFQSPYCISCTQIKPVVDELERELSAQVSIGPQLHIIRVNVQNQIGKDLGSVYGFQATPTFIFFDASGKEVWRQIGNFDPQKVRDSLK